MSGTTNTGYSMTQGGNLMVIASFISLVLRQTGIIEIESEQILQVLEGGVMLVGVVTSWVGRYRRGDVTLGGFRK